MTPTHPLPVRSVSQSPLNPAAVVWGGHHLLGGHPLSPGQNTCDARPPRALGRTTSRGGSAPVQPCATAAPPQPQKEEVSQFPASTPLCLPDETAFTSARLRAVYFIFFALSLFEKSSRATSAWQRLCETRGYYLTEDKRRLRKKSDSVPHQPLDFVPLSLLSGQIFCSGSEGKF